MHHPLKKVRGKEVALRVQLGEPVPPAWPTFVGTAQFVGTSPTRRVAVYVDPTLGRPGMQNAKDLLSDSGRIAAELSECSMGGNLCGMSTGEALSRWGAAVTSNNALADFATAPA